MERAPFPFPLLLLPLLAPLAVADEPPGERGVCVDTEGPSVKYGECGPDVPRVAVVIVVGTSGGTMEKRLGCERDCDRELHVCAYFRVPSPVQTNPPVEEIVEDAWTRALRAIDQADLVEADFGEEPPSPSHCLVRG